jgi:hypothetical protein
MLQGLNYVFQRKFLVSARELASLVGKIISAGSVFGNIYRGYYTAARRYDFYLRVVKIRVYSPKQKIVKLHAQKQIVFITAMHV